ncbi:MAG: hypothetical protein VZR77_04805, partial [Candidatus Enteromonas sp.]|nr:hypothetical protein [Candidatus Enteromonas sp.]
SLDQGERAAFFLFVVVVVGVVEEVRDLVLFVGDEMRIGLKYRLLASCPSSINTMQLSEN